MNRGWLIGFGIVLGLALLLGVIVSALAGLVRLLAAAVVVLVVAVLLARWLRLRH